MFPLISAILAEHNIPDDFKYIALIESGLQNVVSPKGASGYWQFMKTTAKENVSIHEGYYSSSQLETIIGSLGYRQGFQEFFEDNPGAVDTVVEWIISIRDFRTKLINEYDPEELETMGIYDLDEASTSATKSFKVPKTP